MSHGHSFLLHAAAFACPSDVLFWFSYIGGIWVFFFKLMLFTDFVVVNFGFCAVWISERSLILFLKLSLFLVIFVLYNCTLSDSGAHTVQLKCLLWKKTRLRSWVCWLKWSKLPETTSSLLTLTWERVMKNDISMGIFLFFRIAQVHATEAGRVLHALPASSAGWQLLPTLEEESHSCQCH